MKKLVLFLVLIILAARGMSQTYDTIRICDVMPNWYYSDARLDRYSQLCEGNCDIRASFSIYRMGQHIYKRIHTDTALRIIGVAAPVLIAYDSIREFYCPPHYCPPYEDSSRLGEYFSIYAQTDTGLTLLANTEVWDTNTTVRYQMEFNKLPSRMTSAIRWNTNFDTDVMVYYPVYEAYFQKPITVNGTFYVRGSCFNNVTNSSCGRDYSFYSMVDAHPQTIYLRHRVNQGLPEECRNIYCGYNQSTDLYQNFLLLPLLPNSEELEGDTLLHPFLELSTSYSTLCFYPILDTTADLPPENNDTCVGAVGLRVLDISENIVTLTWNQADNNVSKWQISLVAGDTSFVSPADSGLIYSFTNNLAIIGELQPVWYTAYVRSVCNDSLFSHWSDTLFVDMTPDSTTTQPESVVTLADQLTYISPNPAGDVVNVFSSFRIIAVDVISSDGKTVISKPVNGNTTTLNLRELANGSYFVHIHTSGQTTTKKLIIKR